MKIHHAATVAVACFASSGALILERSDSRPHAAFLAHRRALDKRADRLLDDSRRVRVGRSAVEPRPYGVYYEHNAIGGDSYANHGNAGATNPYMPSRDHPILREGPAVPPQENFMPGINAQSGWLFPPDYTTRLTYYDPAEDVVNPFPEEWANSTREGRADRNVTVCAVNPTFWLDTRGVGCAYYEQAQWCTPQGAAGAGWQSSYGAIADYATDGVTALQACCECGGGHRSVTGESIQAFATPLEERRLLAPHDRIPDPEARWFEANTGHLDYPPRPLRPLQAALDNVGLPVRPVAPADWVPDAYARHFKAAWDAHQRPDPKGMSLQYFIAPPIACPVPEVEASAIVLALDYNDRHSYFVGRHLDYVGKDDPIGGIWYGKWTGTVLIVQAGMYKIDLDIAFNTQSSLKIDGEPILTPGQCRVAADKPGCLSKACIWIEESQRCVTKQPPAGPGPGPAPAPGPKPEPAPAPAPAPGPAPGPVPLNEVNSGGGLIDEIELAAGPHCFESIIMVPFLPGGSLIQLFYDGPDTAGVKSVISGQVTVCDPVVPACQNPSVDECAKYAASCGPGPGPAPAPAPAA